MLTREQIDREIRIWSSPRSGCEGVVSRSMMLELYRLALAGMEAGALLERAEKAERERDEARERYARLVDALGVEHTGDTIVHVRVAKRLREDCKRLAFDRDWESDLRRSMQSERDEALRRRTRAERVGEAVLDIGFTVDDAKAVRTIYSWAGNDASRIVNCMRAIADALKEDGNAAG